MLHIALLAQPARPNVQYVNPQQPISTPKDYMVFSIINTVAWVIFCNLIALILSIIAIVKSSSVKKLAMASNEQAALASAKTAKTLNIVALILGILGILGYIIFFVISFLGSLGSMGM